MQLWKNAGFQRFLGSATRGIHLNNTINPNSIAESQRKPSSPNVFKGNNTTENVREESEEDGDETSLAYNLQPEEVEPCHKLRKAFTNSRKNTAPEKIVVKWIEKGHTLTENIVIKLFRAIQQSKRENQAHRLMQWLLEKKPIEITDNLRLLAVLAAQKTGPLTSPTKVYEQIPHELRTPAICAAMVKYYTRVFDVESAEKVLSTFTPKTSDPFNSLITMHLRLGEHDKAVQVFNRLREAGVKLNDVILLTILKHGKHLGIEVDKQEAESILNEGIEQMETSRTAQYAARNSMLAFAYMRDYKGVQRIWSRLRKLHSLHVHVWTAAIEAFGVLGRLDKVEKIMDKFPVMRGREEAFYPALVRAYAMNDRMDKAEAVIKHIRFGQEDTEKTRLTYGVYDELVQGYIERNEHEKAVERMKEARELISLTWSRPAYDTVRKMLPVYAERKDVGGAEALVGLLKRVETVVFKELLKVCVAAERRPGDRFLAMRVKRDDECRELLKRAKEFLPHR